MTQVRETVGRFPMDDDSRWQAVVSRDPAADGHFVYAVATTGIFCRPSCGSRQPLRENVSFYRSSQAAMDAGFRPCKRCTPQVSNVHNSQLIFDACKTIEQSDVAPSLSDLARFAGLSSFHFHRLFKKAVGITPKAYAMACRSGRLRASLSDSRGITDTLYEVGYGSSTRFYATSQEQLGMSPANYRKGGKGEEIRFAVGNCTLGAILVAATTKGICAIDLGDDPEALLQAFQVRFPHAMLVGDDPEFQRLVALAILQVDNPKCVSALPLDVRGTVFQQMIWEELKTIPAGVTLSYAELAARVGRPKAVRAVAGACASNKIAIAIPCHRVVRSDGQLSGYRWGIERKRAILGKERDGS